MIEYSAISNSSMTELDTKKLKKLKLLDKIATADSIKKYLSDNYYNKEQVLSVAVDKIDGEAGEVIYRTGNRDSDPKTKYINLRILTDDIYVCDTLIDLDKCKLRSLDISFKDVFLTWNSFGNYKDLQYPRDANYPTSGPYGISHWQLSDDKKHIVLLINTVDYCGYLSNDKIKNYDAIIKCSASKDNDDDMIGFIAAAVEGNDGTIHTISFIRTPNNQNIDKEVCTGDYHWFCMLDAGSELFNPTDESYGQYCLAHGTLNKTNEDSGAWKVLSAGTLIRVKRVNNTFYGYTTKFDSSISEPEIDNLSYELTINIEELINTVPKKYADILALFIDLPAQFGYSTLSTPGATYDVIQFIIENASKPIINIVTDPYQVECYDVESGLFLIVATGDDIDRLGYYRNGVFSYNTITNKLFYSFGSKIINISAGITPATDTYDLTTFEGLTISMYKLLVLLGTSPDDIQINPTLI